MPLSTKQIQEALLKYFYESYSPYCVTNFSGGGHSESDVLVVSKVFNVTEIEVKISRSDFRKDFTSKPGKHALYAKGNSGEYQKIPNRFYYACPPGLIRPEEIPVYAGLIHVSGYTLKKEKQVFHEIKVMKKAPWIHRFKADPELIFRMCQCLSARSIYGCALLTYQNKRSKELFKSFQ